MHIHHTYRVSRVVGMKVVVLLNTGIPLLRRESISGSIAHAE